MDQIEELLLAIQGISNKLRNIKEQEVAHINLVTDFSVSSFRYIETIHRLKNPSFIELAKNMDLSKPTVTIMINKLIKNGYVQKAKSPGDGRMYYLTLTAKGEEIMMVYNKMYKKFVEQIAVRFNSEEMDTLISLLKRI